MTITKLGTMPAGGQADGDVVPVDPDTFPGYVITTGKRVTTTGAKINPVLKGMIGKGLVPSVACFPLVGKSEIKGVVNVEAFESDRGEEADISLLEVLSSITSLVMGNAELFSLTREDLEKQKELTTHQIEEKRKIKDMFGRFTSPHIVEQLMAKPEDLALGGTRRQMTVLFSDIRGFTTYSENREPEEVVTILNEYLTEMTEIILEHGGTLDKYVGDEIMAIWGAPMAQYDHAELAVKAAVGMVKRLQELKAKWFTEGIEPVDMGIGIHSGDMVVGYMGSPRRMDYTVIGDNVNIGARVEALTRDYSCYIIITEDTLDEVKNIVETTPLGSVSLKGKELTVPVHKIDALHDTDTGERYAVPEFGESEDKDTGTDEIITSEIKPVPPVKEYVEPVEVQPHPAPLITDFYAEEEISPSNSVPGIPGYEHDDTEASVIEDNHNNVSAGLESVDDPGSVDKNLILKEAGSRTYQKPDEAYLKMDKKMYLRTKKLLELTKGNNASSNPAAIEEVTCPECGYLNWGAIVVKCVQCGCELLDEHETM